MKKYTVCTLIILSVAYACKKSSDHETTATTTIVNDAALPESQLNTEQMTQVARLNNDSRMLDYAKACNDFFLNIVPGSSQASVETVAYTCLKPRADALQQGYAGTLFRRTDAGKIFLESLSVQLARIPKIPHNRYFNPDPCRDGFEDTNRKCQADFFADLPTCGAVALASTAFGPEAGIICVAALGLKAMSCRNAAQLQYIRCMEARVHPGESVYFQKDTIIRGVTFRVGASIGTKNKSLTQFLQEEEALENKWSNMSLKEWLGHQVLTAAPIAPIKFP